MLFYMQTHKGAFLAKYSISQLDFFRGSSNLLDSCYEDEAEVFFPFQPLPGKVVFLSKIERIPLTQLCRLSIQTMPEKIESNE